jgi:diguanylate cyclase
MAAPSLNNRQTRRPVPAATHLDGVKRRTYLWVSASGTLIMLLPWLFGFQGGLPAQVANLAYPFSALVAFSVWLVVWQRWTSFQFIERALFAVLAALLLALQLISNLSGEVASFQLQLSVLSVSLVAYLAYPVQGAVWLSFGLFAASLVSALGAALWLGQPLFSLLQPGLQLQIGAALAQLWVALTYNRQAEQDRRRSDDLYQQARLDTLTGLANRRALYEALDAALVQARSRAPLSVVLLDLDHFKAINDQFGHQTGDEVLRELGGLLQGSIREGDIAGRWGGEEFLLILPGADQSAALHLSERVLAMVRGHTWPGGVTLSASFGVSSAEGGDVRERLTERADRNLYRAKDTGRGRVCGDQI